MSIIKCSIPSDKERRRWITSSVTRWKICLAEMNTQILRLEITALDKTGAHGKVQNIILRRAGGIISLKVLQLIVLTGCKLILELFSVDLQESAWVSGGFGGLQKQCCHLLCFQHKALIPWILLIKICASGRNGYKRPTISFRNILSLEIFLTVYMSIKGEMF